MAHADVAEEETRVGMEREFMNATTPHEKWVIFQRSLEWANTRGEITDCLQNDIARLREENRDLKTEIIKTREALLKRIRENPELQEFLNNMKT